MKNLCISVALCVLLLSGTLKTAAETESEVVAKVDGEEILQSDVDFLMNQIALPQIQARNQGNPISQAQKDQLRQNVINQLISQKLILKVASELEIAVEQEIVNQRFEAIKAQYQGVAPEELKQVLETELLFQQTIQHVQQEKTFEITVSDEEARNAYEEQKQQMSDQLASQIDQIRQKLTESPDEESRKMLESQLKIIEEQQARGPFSEPEQVQASHILVKTEQAAADATLEEKEAVKKKNEAAREKIEDILKQVKAEKDFAELAKEFSEGPLSSNGGDLGFFSRGQMVKPFEDAAFALPVGEVSDIVETRFGYHIIKVTEKKAQREVSFEDVKDQFKQTVSQQKINAAMDEWFEGLRTNAKIEIMSQSQPIKN